MILHSMELLEKCTVHSLVGGNEKKIYHLNFTRKVHFTSWTTCKHLRGPLSFTNYSLGPYTRFLTEVYNFIHYVVFKFWWKLCIFLQKMNVKCVTILPIISVVSWIPCAIGLNVHVPQSEYVETYFPNVIVLGDESLRDD